MSPLPPAFAAPCPADDLQACREAKARTVLDSKSIDADQYRLLRAQAIRCAR